MNDLFYKEMTVALHKPTRTEIIIEKTSWQNGQLFYACLIPQKDEKGKLYLCAAQYTDIELEFEKEKFPKSGVRIEIEKL